VGGKRNQSLVDRQTASLSLDCQGEREEREDRKKWWCTIRESRDERRRQCGGGGRKGEASHPSIHPSIQTKTTASIESNNNNNNKPKKASQRVIVCLLSLHRFFLLWRLPGSSHMCSCSKEVNPIAAAAAVTAVVLLFGESLDTVSRSRFR